MIAKIILPVYGGTPAVWTVCMLFFQLILLFSYGYAWFLSRFTKPWIWRLLHSFLILLSLTAFPLNATPILEVGAPDLNLLKFLLNHLGLPLLAIGASAPLLQFAFSQTKAKRAKDPYFLYGVSNLGSLLALLSYPWLIERYIGLSWQLHYWSLGFGFYLLSLFFVFFAVSYSPTANARAEKESLDWSMCLRWISYSFIPCSLMLGLTFYITTDIAATPLFWILPLAFYLLSYIITFAKNPIISHDWVMKQALFFIVFPILGFIFGANLLPAWELIFFHLISFFMLALLGHGELVSLRPPVNQLTSFYFCLALGGVLAGVFNCLLAPRFFNGAYEYPLIIAVALLCVSLPKSKGIGFSALIVLMLLLLNYFLPAKPWGGWLKSNHVFEVLALSFLLIWPKNKATLFTGLIILFVFIFSPWFKPIGVLNQQRNFFGVKQVLSTDKVHVLISQNTLHGFQMLGVNANSNGSMAYYGATLSVIEQLQKRQQSLRAVIIGLGTGMMACQFRASDKLKIIDIDEQVIDIAHNYFSYLRECLPSISLIQGDGRLALTDSENAGYELLVIDAFSSDAIPTHFLTLEAFKLYQQKIAANGVILVNISNRYLKLLPVLMAAGRRLDFLVLHKQQTLSYELGQFASEWVLLTKDEQLGQELMAKEGWRFVANSGVGQLWTDDRSNLLPLMKWFSS
ncbi:MAG: fused MFS/spermidine synthase [Tatlockia sp.]|nr:fused MFS/spermidine synthase [Tatlockia sp.]